MPGWFNHFPAERPQLSVVRIYPYRRRLRIDSLSRTLTDYMVSREFLASILSLPYTWFDFLVATLLCTRRSPIFNQRASPAQAP